MRLDVQSLSLPKDGEIANGDAVVYRVEGDVALLAVIDALGHGPEAAEVARHAVDELGSAPLHDGVERLVLRLHERLQRSRGSAGLLCTIRPGPHSDTNGDYELEACSVGNVEMRVAPAKVSVMLTPGILGSRLTNLRIFRSPISLGERLAIFSDGVAPRFTLRDLTNLPALEACQKILEQHRRPHDDATILVADLRS